MMKRLALLAPLCVCLASAAALPAAAQEEYPGIFSEVIDVRVVNFEVVVTDRDGNRVPGLTADDFRLVVDGNEVPIEYFSEVRGGQALATPAAGAGGPKAVTAVEPGQAVGTSYLVFIDEFFAIGRDRDLVLEKLREELPALGPEDRMAVVAYDGSRLEMLSTWSQSSHQLERVLQLAKGRKTYGLMRLAELRTIESDRLLSSERAFNQREFGQGGFSVAELSPLERDYVRRLGRQIESTVLAATATLRSFAAPPGRKVMLLLSGGWPLEPDLYATGDRDNPLLEPELESGDNLFNRLSDTANLLGYTLYPVDVAGRQQDTVDAADSDPAELLAALTARFNLTGEDLAGQDPLVLSGPATNRGLREFGVHGSLHFLADETGGKALINELRTEPFATVAADTRSYYWLGFSPQRQGDDQRHQVKVEVRRPDLDVRSRSGFFDFSRQREVSMMVESTLLFGNSPASQPLKVEVGSLRPARGGKMEVPLSVTIPLDEVTMLPVDKRYVAQLELRVAALDAKGQRSEVPVVPVQLSGDTAPPPGAHAVYDTRVLLRSEKQKLVVSLHDPLSGSILTAALDIDPRRRR